MENQPGVVMWEVFVLAVVGSQSLTARCGGAWPPTIVATRKKIENLPCEIL